MRLEEYYENFKCELHANAINSAVIATFIENVCSLISEQGGMPDAEMVGYKLAARGIALDAYTTDLDRNRCVMVVADFRDSTEIETLTNEDIKKNFLRLERFVKACYDLRFVEALEASDPVAPIAKYVNENKSSVRFDFILITDAKISKRVHEISPNEYGIEFARQCEVWDIQRLFELETSGKERESLEIDFTEYVPNGIECLKASTGESALQSYLFVLPGLTLAKLYEKYGERLLEQNVRTFLQFRGKVNKGIRNTINQQPSMFFAYNNGLSATAESVQIDYATSRIIKVTNLQIVNGGQTTASIYTAWRNDRALLDRIFVQVKLSLVDSEKVNEIVPKISEYANTQNKVDAADFFSNHPFHLRVEELSRRIWAQIPGQSINVHWFYERTRGQYANAQARLTMSEANKFLLQNPKNKMFKKTDLAKYYLTFSEFPHVVCWGAQKAFAGTSTSKNKGFVSLIAEEWSRHLDTNGRNTSINEAWFKQMISQAILFRGLDKELAKLLPTYGFGSYKSIVVTYTLALFTYHIKKQLKRVLGYEFIWLTQDVPSAIMENLRNIALSVMEFLKTTSEEYSQSNISEFAKKEICWTKAKEIEITLMPDIMRYLQTVEDFGANVNRGRRNQIDINKINVLKYIFDKDMNYWKALSRWDRTHGKLSPMEANILNNVICRGKYPTDRQARMLVTGEQRAIEEGFYYES